MTDRRRLTGLLVLASTLLLARTGAADEVAPARGGEIDVAITPVRLRLAVDEEAEISADLPPGVDRVIFLVAHGQLDEMRLAEGRAIARYRPPDDFLPRVDVIAALFFVDGEPRWGFAALPLVGQGRAVIKTRPFAEAEIHIGDRVYGPVKADRRGRAEIEIEVPPGTTVGVDGEGNEVDLNVPPTARVAVFAARPEILIERAAPVELLAVVVAPDGAQAGAEELELQADRGSVEGVRRDPRGMFLARYLPPASGLGVVEVEARVAGEDRPPAVVELVLVPGGAEAAPGEDSAGGSSEAPVEPLEPKPWLTAALKAGFAWNLGSLQSFDIMADATVKLPLWREQLRVGLELGFTRFASESQVESGALSGATLESATWVVPLAGIVAFAQPLTRVLRLVLGAQGAVVLVENRVSLRAAGARAEEQRELAYGPGAGGSLSLEWEIGPGAALFEVRYLWVGAALESLRGDPSQLFVNLGYRLAFL